MTRSDKRNLKLILPVTVVLLGVALILKGTSGLVKSAPANPSDNQPK